MGFSMGGYIAAAFAARYPHLLAGVLLGGCCHDMHNIKSQLMGRIAAALCRMRSYRTRSQVGPLWTRRACGRRA
jgi:pimeloyl-ACP methyl ester carboxylesterase